MQNVWREIMNADVKNFDEHKEIKSPAAFANP